MEFHVLNLSKLKFHLVHDHAPKLFDESSSIAQVDIMHGLQELPHLRYSSPNEPPHLRYSSQRDYLKYRIPPNGTTSDMTVFIPK
jgi:hypothetical protein